MSDLVERADNLRESLPTDRDRYLYLYHLIEDIKKSDGAMYYAKGGMQLLIKFEIYSKINEVLLAFYKDSKNRRVESNE